MTTKKEMIKSALTYIAGFAIGALAIKLCYACGFFKG